MKKKRITVIAIMLILLISSASFAETVTVVIDGRTTNYRPPATLLNDVVYAPYYDTFKSLGSKDVLWSESKITGSVDSKRLILTINSNKALVNGKEVIMEKPVIILSKYPMVPIKDISEIVSRDMQYYKILKTVVISERKEPVNMINSTLNLVISLNIDKVELLKLLGEPEQIDKVNELEVYTYYSNTDNFIKFEMSAESIISVVTNVGNWIVNNPYEEKITTTIKRDVTLKRVENRINEIPRLSNMIPLLK